MKYMISCFTLSVLILSSVFSQTNTIKIYSDDTTAIGVAALYSFPLSGSNAKQIYVQRGVSNPSGSQNESGKVFKLNRQNYTWYFPSNGFLNATWCFCTCTFTCNPPRYVCNSLLSFAVSKLDTQLIMKNRIGDCGCDAGDAFYFTTNNGTSTTNLTQFSNGFAGIQNYGFDIDPVNDNIMYIGYAILGTSYKCIFKSTNRGTNWIAVDTNSNFATGILKINPLNHNQIFVCGYPNMMMSTTGGTDFFTLNCPRFSSMVFDPVDNSMYGLVYNTTIYKSTNNGSNWLSVSSGNYRSLEISTANHNILYAGSPAGLHRTTNAGANWALYNDSFNPSKLVIGLSMDAMSGDTVFAATTDAVYKVFGGWLAVKQIGTNVPQDFSLEQNFPNPFNPITKIRFSVPAVGNAYMRYVQLLIYDVLGKRVTTLVDEQLSPGIYEAEWDAANYPSGIYFYELRAGDFVQTRKMVLSK